MKLRDNARHEAFAAWNNSKISDDQLILCISDLEEAIDTMQAAGSSGISLMGFIMTLESMKSAQAHRKQSSRSGAA